MAIGQAYDGGIGRAAYLMRFYLQQVYEAAGLRWDGDNDAEIQDMIECIVNAAKQEMAQAMEQGLAAVELDGAPEVSDSLPLSPLEQVTDAPLMTDAYQPDWTQAPKWAQWWAADSDGEVYWYEDKPESQLACWVNREHQKSTGYVDLDGYDWHCTLRQRPEVAA